MTKENKIIGASELISDILQICANHEFKAAIALIEARDNAIMTKQKAICVNYVRLGNDGRCRECGENSIDINSILNAPDAI